MEAPARQQPSPSRILDERVDAWREPHRGGERVQRALYASSLLGEAALLG